MTPCELFIYIEAYYEREQEISKRGLTLAYLTAAWARSKKMPKPESVIGKIKEPSEGDALAEIKKLNAAFGGTTY